MICQHPRVPKGSLSPANAEQRAFLALNGNIRITGQKAEPFLSK